MILPYFVLLYWSRILFFVFYHFVFSFEGSCGAFVCLLRVLSSFYVLPCFYSIFLVICFVFMVFLYFFRGFSCTLSCFLLLVVPRVLFCLIFQVFSCVL